MTLTKHQRLSSRYVFASLALFVFVTFQGFSVIHAISHEFDAPADKCLTCSYVQGANVLPGEKIVLDRLVVHYETVLSHSRETIVFFTIADPHPVRAPPLTFS